MTIVWWGPSVIDAMAALAGRIGATMALVPLLGCGALIGAMLVRAARRELIAGLSPKAVFVAGLLVPVTVVAVAPRLGLGWVVGAAAVSVSVWAGLGPRHTLRRRAPAGDSSPGWAAGLAIAALPACWNALVPYTSSDPAVLAWLVGGGIAGFGLGLGTAQGPGSRAAGGLAPVGVASLAIGGAWLPPLLIGVLAPLGPWWAPLLLVGVVAAAGGLGAGSLAARSSAEHVMRGLAAGLAVQAVLGSWVAPAALALGLSAVAGVLCVGLAARATSLRARLAVAALPILALGAAGLPPGPGESTAPLAAWREYGSPAELERTERRVAGAGLETVWIAGPAGVASIAQGPRGPVTAATIAGSVDWGVQPMRAGRLYGHLGTLLSARPVHHALVLGGLGNGAAADALRRGGASRVSVHEPSAGWTAMVRSQTDLGRALLADPAVGVVTDDPLILAAPGSVDLALVTLPPPWAIGAGHATSARRLTRLASALSEDGVVLFRIALGDLGPDDLARVAGRIGARFETVVAWLDPLGTEHLLLSAWRGPRRVGVAGMVSGWQLRAVSTDAAEAGLLGVGDLLERALTDRDGLLLLADSVRRRDAMGTAVVGGARSRRGEPAVALSRLSTATRSRDLLFSLEGVEPAVREALEQRLAASADARRTYLQLLDHLASGRSTEALGLAVQLSNSASNPARDLATLIDPWLRRGEALLQAGDVDGARAELITAHNFSPKDRRVNLALGRVYLASQKLDLAANHATMVLDSAPTDLEAALLLADVRVGQGRLADAVALLEEAEPSHPGDERLLTNLAYLLTQLAVGSDSTIAQRLARARLLYQRAAALAPRWPQPRAGLAEIYYRLEDHEAALREIDRALALEDSCRYRSWRGHILAAQGLLREAESELQTALLGCPRLIDALVMLGGVQAEQRRLGEARESWERALSVDPTNAAARRNLEMLTDGGLELLQEQRRRP